MYRFSVGAVLALFLLVLSSQTVAIAAQQVPDNVPSSPHYHTRYLPALGVANLAQNPLEDRFGAFAMSEGTGWSGWILGARTKIEAELGALYECSTRGGGLLDCEVVISFQNQCGSVVGAENHSGFGTADTLDRARELAAAECEAQGPGCKVFREGCSLPAPAK